MNKKLCALLLAACTLAGTLAGCNTYTDTPQVPASQTAAGPADPAAALEAIYQDCQVDGILEGDAKILEEKFLITPDLYTEKYVRYADGRFGIADVFILKPAADKAEALREALENAQMSRISEFANYDIYNAHQLAQDGEIFEVGDYLVLTMIENADQVRALLEQDILQQVSLLPASDTASH